MKETGDWKGLVEEIRLENRMISGCHIIQVSGVGDIVRILLSAVQLNLNLYLYTHRDRLTHLVRLGSRIWL